MRRRRRLAELVKGWQSSAMTTMVIDGNGGACGC